MPQKVQLSLRFKYHTDIWGRGVIATHIEMSGKLHILATTAVERAPGTQWLEFVWATHILL